MTASGGPSRATGLAHAPFTGDIPRLPPVRHVPRHQAGLIGQPLIISIALTAIGVLIGVWFHFHPTAFRAADDRPSQADRPLSPKGPATTEPTLLRLTGSNTIGSDLAPALAKAFLEQRLGAVNVTVYENDEAHFKLVKGRVAGQAAERLIEITAAGSGFAFEALARHAADIGMSSRPVKPEERLMLAELGDMTAPSAEHVIGLDGIAVIVHPSNPLQTLTLDQVRRIFTGRVKNWSELGGAKRSIHRFARNRESGTHDFFTEHTLRANERLAADTRYITESHALSDAVAKDPSAIGFIGLPYIGQAKALKLGAIDKVAFPPSKLSVYREDYPLARRLYLYTPGEANPLVSDFLSFALSPEGQAIVESAGFVGQAVAPVASDAAARPLPPDAPKRYVELTRSADAVPFSVRFKPGTSEPDAKARADLPRLAQVLISPEYRKREAVLVAFGGKDDPVTGAPPDEDEIAAIKAELQKLGLTRVKVEDLGAALPIAPEDTPEGREKNRRIEIWVMR